MTTDSPWEKTEPNLHAILEDLKTREPIFHRPELGTTRQDYQQMIVPDFWEVGASGRRYGTNYVLNTLEQRQQNREPDHWQTDEFHCRELAPNLYLLTYTLRQGEGLDRVTRRATIWENSPSGWKIVYHQGTIVE